MLEMARRARQAAQHLNRMESNQKNAVLSDLADLLLKRCPEILQANLQDMEQAEQAGLTAAMIKRLSLDERKVAAMAEGLRALVQLEDPVGQVESSWLRPNGLEIKRVRVPFGVIGIIYESRPNVTIDAGALCLKAGSASLLRGGKEAVHSNRCLTALFREALRRNGFPEDAVQLVVDPDRSLLQQMLKMHGQIDLLIPRGGSGLIQHVVEHSTVPVVETGVGNCHVYLDADADHQKAVAIAINAKISNPAVCNAAETLLVHRQIAPAILTDLVAALLDRGVELRMCRDSLSILEEQGLADHEKIKPATEEDWSEEYLDLIYAVKIVDDLDEAIAHIQTFGTGHSEAIVTENYSSARRFTREVDAAAVYVNASTRFTDGFEFGYGAEIGISTQKLHTRGPMGLRELTTIKNIVYGDGQVRI